MRWHCAFLLALCPHNGSMRCSNSDVDLYAKSMKGELLITDGWSIHNNFLRHFDPYDPVNMGRAGYMSYSDIGIVKKLLSQKTKDGWYCTVLLDDNSLHMFPIREKVVESEKVIQVNSKVKII